MGRPKGQEVHVEWATWDGNTFLLIMTNSFLFSLSLKIKIKTYMDRILFEILTKTHAIKITLMCKVNHVFYVRRTQLFSSWRSSINYQDDQREGVPPHRVRWMKFTSWRPAVFTLAPCRPPGVAASGGGGPEERAIWRDETAAGTRPGGEEHINNQSVKAPSAALTCVDVVSVA